MLAARQSIFIQSMRARVTIASKGKQASYVFQCVILVLNHARN